LIHWHSLFRVRSKLTGIFKRQDLFSYSRLTAILLVSGLLLLTFFTNGQRVILHINNSVSESSFRSLSVVNDSVIWLAGNNGTVCRSTDGGKNFNCIVVPGNDSADFRSIYAFDSLTAVIGNTGTPAQILRTENGGKTWNKVFEENNPSAFIDGIDFWNENEGICFGDPHMNKLMVVKTEDGGKTWNHLPFSSRPGMVDGEGSFAASNTSMRCLPGGRLIITTGGPVSRLLISEDMGKTWDQSIPPIIHGTPSTGIFSFDFYDSMHGVVTGGDFKLDSVAMDNLFITSDGGKEWLESFTPVGGYRECVLYITADLLLTAGPNGIDISRDGGKNWKSFSKTEGWHAMQLSPSRNMVFLTGKSGLNAIIRITEK